MKKRHKSKAAQAAAERHVELYVRLLVLLRHLITFSSACNSREFEDQVIVEEYLLRNAIERSINTLFGEVSILFHTA